MTDIIRQAVELADRWEHADGNVYLANGTFIDESTDADFDNMDQILLDALAAQLVRQVDGIDGIEVIAQFKEVTLWAYDSVIGEGKGPDRTLNTITAIVESGVLR